MKTDNRFPFVLQEEDFKDILKKSCLAWTEFLVKKFGLDILLNRKVEITKAFYEKMRSGCCTKQQHELLDRIFGSDGVKLNAYNLQIGEAMIVTEGRLRNYLLLKIGRYTLINVNDGSDIYQLNGSYKLEGRNEIIGKKVKLTITHEVID